MNAIRVFLMSLVLVPLVGIVADADSDWRSTRILRACLAGPSESEIDEMARVGANVIQCNLNAPVTEGDANPGILGGDAVADFVDCTHRLKAKAVGYLNTRLTRHLKDHPDWRAANPDGSPIGGDINPSACQNSPYGQYLIDRMVEYTKKTTIDGWWLDCWTFGIQTCWCRYCKEQFTKETGLDMPSAPDLSDSRFRGYVEWRDEAAGRFFKRMRDSIKAVRPDVHIWVNFNAGLATAPLPHSDSVFRMVESPTVEQYLAGQLDFALTVPFSIARLRGAAGGRETEIWMNPTPLQWDRTTTPDVEVMARVYTILTYGSIVQFPTSPGHYDQMKTAFDAIKAREKWLVGAKPLKWAAVVLSYRTPEFYGRNDAVRKYYHEIMGVFRALSEEHVPFEIVTEADVEQGRLADYRVAILPNTACLTDEALAAVSAYVGSGGGLVATHETSLYSRYGDRRDDFALADLLGAHYVGEEESKGWQSDRLWLEDHPSTQDQIIEYSKWRSATSTPREWLGSVDWAGFALNVNALDGSQVLANRNGLNNQKPTWPALVISEMGKGRVAFFPMEIGASYYHTSYPYLRRWLHSTLLWAGDGEPPVEVEAPRSLLSTYWQQNDGKRIIVHLLNDMSSTGRRARDAMYLPIRDEVIPIRGVRIMCRMPGITKAILQPGGVDLKLRAVAGGSPGTGGVEVTVPEVEQHSMVVFEAK